jgi:hypothetical protein
MNWIACRWRLSDRSKSHWNAPIPRWLGVVLLAIACSALPPSPRLGGLSNQFSGEAAQAHAVSLAALGPRLPGSRADELARRYLTREFRASGARVRVAVDGELRHLVAEIPGDSPDALLLVAAYPDLERDEWIGDSGAALLLELARVLSQQRPRYTLQFALAETRPAAGDVQATQVGQKRSRIWLPVDSRMKARSRIVAAGESLARALVAEADLERLRGVLVFDAPARPGLRIARDLRSHPVYRDVFWQSASALGFESTFPSDGGWASPLSLHLGLRGRSIDPVVALVDEAWARPELEAQPVLLAHSASTFESLGLVTLEAVGRIMHRLARVDAFAPRP